MQDYWFYEKHTEGYEVRWRITEILHQEATPYQKLAVIETVEWGRALILDGVLQIADKDEYIYHEMITHVTMNGHPHPQDMLIIGGGDGGALREAVKHPDLRHLDLVEIDRRVAEISQQYFPRVSCAFADPRVNVHFADGFDYIKAPVRQYDLVIVDSSDPVGPSIKLFSEEFYRDLHQILRPDGMVVVQSESPVFYADQFAACHANLRQVFPIVEVYLAPIATYVSGPWSFTIGSKRYDPRTINNEQPVTTGLQYYTEELHRAAFCLPGFVRELILK
ncbi:MAG: polyamine aminopropyltransferase [Syntrophomonadaceae bacterium]|nr:polyamine aminopropyltransferase [Syntrophomonadaceae bacterium]